MSCDKFQPELVGYHFGLVAEETRQELEQHLVGCPDCIRAFVAIKRDIETAESAPAPSERVRQRLRRSVAQELGLVEPQRKWSWWERPLAFSFAGAAVVAALFAVHVLASSAGSMPHGLRAQPSISRPAGP
jgi:anti-sigma factor RsiW